MMIENAISEVLEQQLADKLPKHLEAIITRAVARSQPSEHGSDRLTLHEVAKRLGLSYRAVKARVDAGELRGFADGRSWFVLLRDVWEYNEHLASEIDDNERDLLRRSLGGM
jgi:excisionase family DNA binding protein